MILKLIPDKPHGEFPMAHLYKDKNSYSIGAILINNFLEAFGIKELPEEIEVNVIVGNK